MENLQYPIGKFKQPEIISKEDITEAINILKLFPEQLRLLLLDITDEKLDTPYRPGGWTIRQLVHHIADSHHNSYLRYRWALTEENPTIKAYDEKAFAALGDYKTAPIAWSLSHIESVHHRWVYLLQSFTIAQWKRCFTHPDTQKKSDLAETTLVYAWHSMHHFAHIKNAL